MEMYEKFPGLLDGTLKNHHIHTHHSMGTFFSGTDWSQMEDRSENCNYLLMLIVNLSGNYCAKIGTRVKKSNAGSVVLKMVNNTDGYEDITLQGEAESEALMIMDCDIEKEGGALVPETFLERYKAVKDDKKVVVYSSNTLTKDPWKNFQDKNKTSKWGEDKTLQKGTQAFIEFDSTNVRVGEDNRGYYDRAWDNDGWDEDTPPSEKKVKSIMDMTDKEWAELNEQEYKGIGKKYGQKDVYIFLNALIDGAIFRNSSYPGDRMIKMDKTKVDRAIFLERLEAEVFDYFNDLFPNSSDDDFVSLLKTTRDMLKPWGHYNIFKYSVEIINKQLEKEFFIADKK